MRPRSIGYALISVVAGILLLVGLAVTVAYFHLRSSVQSLSGNVRVAGLEAPVTVVLDSVAIPHVFASGEEDLFFAQGFLHASERLWQMEMFRRVAQGRLAELFGERSLGTDRFLRTLDLWGAAERSLAATSAAERQLLEAYAAGVNERLRTWSGPLPPEFVLLGIEPEPWEPRLSVAIGKIIALDLSSWRTKLSRFRAAVILPPEKLEYLIPQYPEWGPTTVETPLRASTDGAAALGPVPSGRSRSPFEEARDHSAAAAAGLEWGGEPAEESAWSPFRLLSRYGLQASNAWAVDGSRSLDGHPLLANDMHLGLDTPAKWYIVGLHASDTGYDVAGVSLPGAPGVVVGYNRGIAWGFTNGMTDDVEFAIEAPSPDGARYREGDRWREFAARPETIQVRGAAEPVVHEVRGTSRGPIITDVIAPLDATLSLMWVASRPTTELEGLLAMNRATDPAAFDAAIREFDSPNQNVVYAATDGTIGYRLSGTVPVREGYDGALPVESEVLGAGWERFWPADSLPAVESPERGFIASANNLQAPGAFGVLGTDYPPPFRARQIVDRLGGERGWTVRKMAELQHDVYSLLGDRLSERAIAAAERAGEDSAAVLLRGWDRDVQIESAAAAVFYTWFYRLRALFAGDEFEGETWTYFPTLAVLRILDEEGGAWVTDSPADSASALSALEERAMSDAVRATELRTWGELHQERSVHTLGRVGLLDRILALNIGPYPSPGGPNTVRPDDYGRWSSLDSASWTPPFLGEYGPSQRFVAEMRSTGAMGWLLLPTGQSGNPFSDHYRDMAPLWERAELIPVPLEREEADRRAVRRLHLRPEPS